MSATNVRSIQWAMWGNESALLGAYELIFGGIVGIIGGILQPTFLFWLPIGIYGLVFGILISVIEYPRGKKNKGNTVARCHQEIFTKLVDKLPFIKIYYYRAFIFFIVCLPTLMIVPTLLGGVCVIIGCIIYFSAAVKNESWNPVIQRSTTVQEVTNLSQPPSQPPPRLPANVT